MSDKPKNFPAPSIDVMVVDEQRTVTMYFSLLSDLANVVGSIERIGLMSFDPGMRDRTLFLCLAPRDERGKITDPDYRWPWHMSVEAGEAILDWVGAHLLDFFIGRLRKHLVDVAVRGEELTEVGASLNGLAASASKM